MKIQKNAEQYMFKLFSLFFQQKQHQNLGFKTNPVLTDISTNFYTSIISTYSCYVVETHEKYQNKHDILLLFNEFEEIFCLVA